MADETFRLDAEFTVDASDAIRNFQDTERAAAAFTRTLQATDGALNKFFNTSRKSGGALKNTISKQDAEALERTLKVYQQLNSAMGAYARTARQMQGVDVGKTNKKLEQSIRGVATALRQVTRLTDEDAKKAKNTLAVYKQLTDVHLKRAQALTQETAALKNKAAADQAAAEAAARPKVAGAQVGLTNARTQEVEARAARDSVANAKKIEEADQRIIASKTKTQIALQREARMQEEHARRKEAAARRAAEADKIQTSPATRYALYEVAAAYSAVSAAALAVPVAATTAATSFERSFANVLKVTTHEMTPAMRQLKEELVAVTTDIPLAFDEVTKISTLGAQMDVAESSLASFTETVALFVATSEGVNNEQAAMSFGRLGNMLQLTANDYKALASAVSELGSNAVATEAEVLANAESIATTANMAGFTAAEVVGLSTALASLRVRPEMARGAMQRIFAQINKAVGDGGEALENWARAAGLSADQAARMWQEDPSQFFQRVTAGIAEQDDNIQRSIMIREQLELRNVRDVEMLSRLANGYEVYAQSMALADDAYSRADFLDSAASAILETTHTHLIRLGNAFKAFLASFGGQNLSVVNAFAEIIITVLEALTNMPAPLRSTITMLTLFIGTVAAIKAAMALAMASMVAYRQIMKDTGLTGGVTFGNLRAQAGATFPFIERVTNGASAALARYKAEMAGATGVAGKAGAAVRGFGGAVAGVSRIIGMTGWIGLGLTALTGIVTLFQTAGQEAERANQKAEDFLSTVGGSQGLFEALQKDAAEFASGEQSKAFGELSVQFTRYREEAESTQQIVRGQVIPAQDEHTAAVQGTTEAMRDGVWQIGKYTDELMRNAVVQSDMWKNISPDRMKALLDQGFDLEEWITRWQTGGAASANAYLDEFSKTLINARILGEGPSQQMAQEAQFAVNALRDGLTDLNPVIEETQTRMMAADAAGMDFMDDATDGALDAGDAIETLEERLSSLVDEMFAAVDAEMALAEAMASLGQSIDENGTSFDIWTEGGRANMEALRSAIEATMGFYESEVEAGRMTAEEAADAFAFAVQDLMAQLESMNIDTAEFEFIRDYLDTLFVQHPLTPQVDTAPAINDLTDLGNYAVQIGSMVNTALGQRQVLGPGLAVATPSKPGFFSGGTGTRLPSVPKPPAPNRPAPRKGPVIDWKPVEAERASAAAERLRDEADNAAKSTKDNAEQAKRLKDEIAQAADKTKIFEDTMKALGEAFDKTFERNYGFDEAQDKVELALINMRKAAEDAKKQVADLREEHRKLMQEAADARIEARQASLFASIAQRYGDTERYLDYSNKANEANATVKEKERLAAAASKEADAIEANMFSLTGYSEQAIKNREQLRSLQRTMADAIIAYAKTGASQQDVTRYAEQLRRKFIDQSVQMGYNHRDISRMSSLFQELKRDIDRVPRQVRVKADADIAEAQRKLRDLTRERVAPVRVQSANKEFNVKGVFRATEAQTPKLVADQVQSRTAYLDYGQGIRSNWARDSGGLIPGKAPSRKDNLAVLSPSGPVGTIRSGEFVVQQKAVDAYGLDYMHAINNMRAPMPVVVSSGGGSAGGGGIQLVELLPHQIRQIASAVSTILNVDGKVIAATTNARNTAAARRGAN